MASGQTPYVLLCRCTSGCRGGGADAGGKRLSSGDALAFKGSSRGRSTTRAHGWPRLARSTIRQEWGRPESSELRDGTSRVSVAVRGDVLVGVDWRIVGSAVMGFCLRFLRATCVCFEVCVRYVSGTGAFLRLL